MLLPLLPESPPVPGSASCRLNSFLDNVDAGDVIVKGDLEAYSCEWVSCPLVSLCP